MGRVWHRQRPDSLGCLDSQRERPPYGKHVLGRRITVAQQAVAEVRYDAIAAGWNVRGRASGESLP